MIDDLQLRKPLQDVALILAALLSRERLLVNSEDDKTDSVGRGKRATYERAIISILSQLDSFGEDNDDLIHLLTNVLGEGALLLKPLGGVSG